MNMIANTVPYIDILGVKIWSINIESFINHLKDNICKNRNLIVTATGAHGLIESLRYPLFRNVLETAYINLPDGMPLTWIGRAKGAKQMSRCYGPDVFRELISATATTRITHFFCGGKDGIAQKLVVHCDKTLGNSNVVGWLTPPFSSVEEYDYKNIAKEIMKTNPNIVWIGLSTPKQEVFAYHLSKHLKVDYIITVGAAFDFHTGMVSQAPQIMQNMGMEWFYRLLMEPKRLFSRYIDIVPKFLVLGILDIIKHIIKVEKS